MERQNRVLREFLILSSILEKGNDAGIRETAKELGLAPSTVHRILSVLQQSGYVRRLKNGRYAVGIELVRLALLVLQNFDQNALIHQTLQRAVEATGETCVLNIVTADHSQVFVMDVAHSSHPLQYQIKVGDCHQITAGSSGQAAFAFFPRELQEQIIAKGLTRYTRETILDRRRLMERVEQVRRQRFAITKGEHIEGAVGIAVPIFVEMEGVRVAGTVSATIPQQRFREEMAERIVTALKNASGELAVLLAAQFGTGSGDRTGAETWPLRDPDDQPK
ncbi:MAG TPA: IclR family transcriptional regulator [Paenibacillaceae bacterium]